MTGGRCRMQFARVGCLHTLIKYLDTCKRQLKAQHCKDTINRVRLSQSKRRLQKVRSNAYGLNLLLKLKISRLGES